MDEFANVIISSEGATSLNVEGFEFRIRRIVGNRYYWKWRQTKVCKASFITEIRNRRHFIIKTSEHTHDINNENNN